MGKPLRVLIVEDLEDDALLTVRALQRGGYDVAFERVETAATMTAALEGHSWDLVIADFSMPQFSGSAALSLLRARDADVPFIFVSGTIGEDTAVTAMRGGAQDYLIKGNLARLLPAVERELRESERRRGHRMVERQLRQMEKFESLGKLAGGIAHDFNNLLGVIIGYCEVLHGSGKLGDKERQQVQEIHKAGERAATLTRQLLAFSRKQILEPRVMDLKALIADMGRLLQRLIGEDIELVTTAPRELGRVRADPGQIEQVLMNLAVNARDAMPKGGQITIETADVELDETFASKDLTVQPGRYIMLAVSDTGSGIDPQTLSRIFEPFFTTKEGGTGLGLATVYGIVKQSGGTIWVYSEEGRGTTFKIYLPRVEQRETAAPDRPREASGGQETILLVEDAEPLRTVTATFLREGGYQLLEAGSGAEALKLIERYGKPIHLLLTDVVMPEVSGVDLAQRVQARHPHVRVLYISGYTDDALVRHGVLTGAVFILSKPFSREALLNKVRAVLDNAESGHSSGQPPASD
ncbi:MAG: response regulator [Candidatus Acidiferrales bacterium]